jgi:transposase-like protein
LAKLRHYSEEFRTEAIRLALNSGQSVRQTALDLGMSNETLSRWLREDRSAATGGVTLAGAPWSCWPPPKSDSASSSPTTTTRSLARARSMFSGWVGHGGDLPVAPTRPPRGPRGSPRRTRV